VWHKAVYFSSCTSLKGELALAKRDCPGVKNLGNFTNEPFSTLNCQFSIAFLLFKGLKRLF